MRTYPPVQHFSVGRNLKPETSLSAFATGSSRVRANLESDHDPGRRSVPRKSHPFGACQDGLLPVSGRCRCPNPQCKRRGGPAVVSDGHIPQCFAVLAGGGGRAWTAAHLRIATLPPELGPAGKLAPVAMGGHWDVIRLRAAVDGGHPAFPGSRGTDFAHSAGDHPHRLDLRRSSHGRSHPCLLL